MNTERTEIALYGKGGIGKSTISANLAAALQLAGKRVLQIGCDPKHDSTRLLLGGETIPTVLEYLRDVTGEEADPEAILHRGWHGIGCIEAGGPKPGIGCAGRGILSAFDFLSRNRIRERYDVVLYDVLGDVVCGGFAVPIRREYADAVYLVTSGEYMAVYAANNILRGILNYDGDSGKRVAGIILNRRNLEDEEGRVERFAEAVGLPVCARVPRSEAFAAAEARHCPLADLPEYVREQEVFTALAAQIAKGPELYAAGPLTDEALEQAVLGTGRVFIPAAGESGTDTAETDGPAFRAGSPDQRGQEKGSGGIPEEYVRAWGSAEDVTVPKRPPLYGCAFNGAATTALMIRDAVVIAHSPRSCAFYTWQNLTSSGRKSLFNRGILLPSAVDPHFTCTEIGHTEAVFGGTVKLRDCVRKAVESRPGAVIVVSSCVSGIIGDDIRSVEELSAPEVPVITIPADGDISGDYMEGIRMCLHAAAERLIDTRPAKHTQSVNLVGEISVLDNLETNFGIIRDLLARMGIGVNCRIPGGALADELRRFLEAPLNILADSGADNLAFRDWLTEKYGCRFAENILPVGFARTASFLREIGDFFSCRARAEEIIEEEESRYRAGIGEVRDALAGKKLLLTSISTDMDWLLDAAADAGIRVVWAGVADYLNQGAQISDREEIRQVTEKMTDIQTVLHRVREYGPDIVLSNYTAAIPPGRYIVDNIPMVQRQGFDAGIHVLRGWVRELKGAPEGEWRHDREQFQKYYS